MFILLRECIQCFFQKVVGWDTVNNDYDKDETDGRSYISAISQSVVANQTCNSGATRTKGQVRMVSL